jgi:flagellar hook protein FlgE
MFSAISGLRVHQQEMDVVGNNIANVNTVGYKGSSTVFEDTLTQILRHGTSANDAIGGNNPAQFGLGVQLATVSTNFSQGNAQTTGRATDFMINGDGFFVTRAGTEQLFTRAGSFSFDGTGNLVSPDGSILQGWVANPDTGVVNPNSPVGDLNVHFGETMPPKATTSGTISGNLPADASATDAITFSIDMYDSRGVKHAINYTLKKTDGTDNSWDVAVDDGGKPLTSTPASITFGTNGKLDPGQAIEFTPEDQTGWGPSVKINIDEVTQYGAKNTVTATKQDGYALGSLSSFSLGSDGLLSGIYNNGQRMNLGQLALASFNNPGGLEKAGNSSWRAAENSGLPKIGQAVSGGRGTLSAGQLEMSNVDLSQEFTNLIIAQRGFQANSRVITASDEILQDLVNLKR